MNADLDQVAGMALFHIARSLVGRLLAIAETAIDAVDEDVEPVVHTLELERFSSRSN